MKTGELHTPILTPLGPGLTEWLNALPQWLTPTLLLLMLVIIGWLDFITGWEWSLFVLYSVPILLAVWWQGRNAGLAISAIAAFVWWHANHPENPYQTNLGYNMAMLSRLVYFVMTAVGGAGIRNKQLADAEHIGILEERRRLEMDIVAVSEHEQQRIGQDLHDGLCQQLAAIGCAARALAEDLQARNLPEAMDAAHIESCIQEAVLEARSMARGIFPVHVDRSGLSTALTEMAQTTTRLTGIPINITEQSEVHVSDPDVAMHLYRIAQESVANAVRHSGAHRVTISLEAQDDYLELRIEDDGCGILEGTDKTAEGMGLRTMRYRAQALGAELTVEPSLSGGTIVRCKLKVRTLQPEQDHGQN